MAVLLFHLIQARSKAKEAARTEVISLLREFEPQILESGPLADQKAVFWIKLPDKYVDSARIRIPWLGYSKRVELLESIHELEWCQQSEFVHWKKKSFRLRALYHMNDQELREQAVDRRKFLLEAPATGRIREITGYRGNSGKLGRRGLPVCDARLLVNLVYPGHDHVLLDPFAGAGGVVFQAIACGLKVKSCDIDPILRPGLIAFGSDHYVQDAALLPFEDRSIDAIASEPPYDESVAEVVLRAFDEMFRVLKPSGRIALFCARSQIELLKQRGELLNIQLFLDTVIDRKGTDCSVLAWEKDAT